MLRTFALLALLLTLAACGGGGSAPATAEVDSVKAVTARPAEAASPTAPPASGSTAPTGAAEEPLLPPRTKVTRDTDPDPDPNDFVQVEYEAVPQNEARVKALVRYPAELKGKNIKGTVYVKVLIDKDGYYKRHLLRDSPDPALAQAVVDQVKYLYYTPARKDGKPVKVWVNFEYEFK